MSIQLTITASDAVDLGAQIANLFHTMTSSGPMIMPAEPAVLIEPVAETKKPRGRPAKAPPPTIEGTVNTPAPEAPAEPSETPDAGQATDKTIDDVRAAIIAYVNDVAAAGDGSDDAKRKALQGLRDKFGFQKVPDIDPKQFGAVLAYIEQNTPSKDDDGIV